jgi:preprotein translocase SecE subunit
MNKIISYIKETKEEMKNVKWPTRSQTINFTIAVILVSVLIAYYLGFFDYVFKTGLEQIINK